MQVTETNTSGLKREYKVVVPAGDLKSKVDSKLVELGQKVRLDGFRPGKGPGEVINEAVNEGSHKLMHENNLRPAGQPKVEITKFEENSDLEFSVAMEVIPDIKPMDFKSVKLERVKVEVPDKEVDDRLEMLAKRQGSSDVALGQHFQ